MLQGEKELSANNLHESVSFKHVHPEYIIDF